MNARFLFVALAAVSICVPAAAAKRNYTVTSFDRIRVDGPYRVKLTTGVSPFARAEGSAAALDGVEVVVEGRTLIVRKSQSGWGGYPGKDKGPATISLGTHEITALWVNGSGSLDVSAVRGQSFNLSLVGSGAVSVDKLDVDRLNASVMGSGSARISGKAARATASARGTGALDGSALTVKDATIASEGAAVLKLVATNSAKIDARGTATVEMTGDGACTVRSSGSAVVSGCD